MDELAKSLGINTHGVKYSEMTPDEKKTFESMLDSVRKHTLSVDMIRDYIHSMRDAVEQELTRFDLTKEEDLYLKARLRNYMLLESFLISPERAKKELEKALKNVK